MPNVPFEPALGGLERTVGFLVTLAGAIALTWVVERNQRFVAQDDFKQARNIGIAATAVFIALMFVFMGDSTQLVALGTTAAGGVVGSITFFLWNVWAGTQTRKRPRLVITYLATFILYIICGSVGLSAAGLLIYVVQTNPANKTIASGGVLQTYDVEVQLEGRRVVTRPGEPIPFRASSGQANFSCEQTVSAKAVWQRPSGSTIEGEVRAAWENVANARAHQAVVEVDDSQVAGIGTITGLDLQRLPFGITNCPGGGHGELVVSGTYVTRGTIEQPHREQLRAELSASPGSARSVRLTLPAAQDIELERAVVTLRRGDRVVDSAEVSFAAGASSLSVRRSSKRVFAVSVEKEQLVITVEQPPPGG